MPLDQARWQIDILAADKTSQAFRSVERNMQSLQLAQKALAGDMASGFALATRALGPLTAGLTAAAIAHKVWTTGMAAGALRDEAEQIGLTTDQLQAYRLAAAQSGVSTEQLDAAMMSLTRQMAAAMGGNDDLIAKFDKLGVKLIDSAGNWRKTADIAPELARGLLALSSETERNALSMEFFGKSGARMVTVYGQLARGNDELVEATRKQNALIGGETIEAWNELSTQLSIADKRLASVIATAGLPIVKGGLFVLAAMAKPISDLAGALGALSTVWTSLTDGSDQTSSEDLIKRADAMKAWVDVHKESTDAIDVAKLANYRAEIERINNVLASRAVALPPRIVTGSTGGSQPGGKGAAAAAARAAEEAARESRREMDELVASVTKGEEAYAKLVLAGQQFVTLQEVEQRAVGMTAEVAARMRYEQQMLNQAERENVVITDARRQKIAELAAEMARAEEATRRAREMNEFYKDTTKSFLQDVNRGLREGANVWDAFGNAANNALSRISDKLMEMAINDLWSAAFPGGVSAGLGGLLSGLFGDGMASGAALDALSSQAAGFIAGGAAGFADGGQYQAGRARIVGEKGWELDVPNHGGTIYNQEQLAEMLGGSSRGGTIVIQQTVMVGSVVSQAQHERDLAAVKDAAMTGAKLALLEDVKSGGSTRSILRG